MGERSSLPSQGFSTSAAVHTYLPISLRSLNAVTTYGYIVLYALILVVVVTALFAKDHELALRRANKRIAELERRVNVLVSKTGINTSELPPRAMFQDKPRDTFCD